MTPPSDQFGKLPTAMVASGSLRAIAGKPAALLTYVTYIAFADSETMESWPSEAYISESCGIDADSVRRARRALEEAGLLADTGRRIHRCKVYRIVAEPRSDTGFTPRSGAGDGERVTPQRCGRNPARRTRKPRSGEGLSERSEGIREKHAHKTPLVEPTLPGIATPPASGEVGSAIAFPTQGGPAWALTTERLAEYVGTFPALDVTHELRKARLWLLDNPDRRKTARGMPRFLTGWLGRARPASATCDGKVPADVLDRICPPTEPTDEDLREAYR